jgi:hypothetical protein
MWVVMVRSRFRTAIVAVCGVALVGLAAGSSAEAGGYHVYSCRTPSGAVAPTDGWMWSKPVDGPYDYTLNTCESGGALVAALGDEAVHLVNTEKAIWMFAPPTGATIVGATLWRAGDNGGESIADAVYQFWLAGPTESEPFSKCLETIECPGEGELERPFAETNRVVVPSSNLGTKLYLIAFCGGTGTECRAGKGDAHEYATAVYLYAADIVMEQTVGPTASNVSGELATAPAVRGTSDVAFDATDPGSGVYEAVFSLDGQTFQTTVLDGNGGHCQDVGGTSDGLPAFLYTQPCAPSVSVDVPFDTTGISNGTHHLIVSVSDAAGDSAPVLDREITVANPPPPGTPGPPNGTNASAQATLSASWVGSKKARIASAYGRAHTIAGRLEEPGGVPIAGAELNCTATPATQGAKPVTMACPHTGPTGRFEVKVPGNVSSRTIALAYREHLGDALPVATRALGLSMKAGVSLRVSPHTTSVGRSIRLTGKLLGGPIPHGGKQLVLEARSPGGPWIEFDVLRTTGRGRFHDSYRFKFPGPVSYRFRAVSESEADYPFATGASNTVGVFER